MPSTDTKIDHELLRVMNRGATGNLFYATVVSVDPTSYHVTVAPQGNNHLGKMQARIMSSILCNSLGFKLSYLPTIGSIVFCYATSTNECLILGMVPLSDKGAISPASTRTVIGAGDGLKAESHRQNYNEDLTKTLITNLGRPTDILQGELAISNEFGVLLGLFQQFAVLKASELAQVQCFLLDDLVRIISHNFQHFHSMGQLTISHDGNSLNLESGMTHDPKEALGVAQLAQEKVFPPPFTHNGETTVDDVSDYYEPGTDERAVAVERLKTFVGRLGDFINLLLVVPADETRILDGLPPNSFDSGVLQLKANLDGLFILRSAKGVVIEKTNWIRVPHRIRTSEDPTGDDGTKQQPVRLPDFVFDNTYRAAEQPFLYYLQLRDYLSYIQEGCGYRHFTDRPLDFAVNDDFALERPLAQLTYVDPVTGASYMKKTSSVVLMPNGGLSLRDAWSSSINMEGGNIYIQPAKDLVLQPMRHLIGKIGGCVSLAVKKDIDLSSTEGAYRLKTDGVQYLYSKVGGIVLHTDAPALGGDNGYIPSAKEEALVVRTSGIVIKAPVGGIYSNATVNYQRYERSSVIEAPVNTLLASEQLLVLSDKVLELLGATTLLSATGQMNCFSKKQAFFIGEQQTLIGRAGQTFGLVSLNGVPVAPVEGLMKEDPVNNFFKQMNEIVDKYDKLVSPDLVYGIVTKASFDGLLFRYPATTVYGNLEGCPLPQTLTQQEDQSFNGLHNLTVWSEPAEQGTYPYPGAASAEGLVGRQLVNLLMVDDELVNKSNEHESESELDSPVNIFDSYRVYNL